MVSRIRQLTQFFAIVCAPLTTLGAQQRQVPRDKFPAELDRYIARALGQGQIPGIAVAVVRNDSTLVAKGYGVRQLGKPDRVDPHTVFDVAQLTNSFIATAAGMLVDRGALRWDDPVGRHLPTLALPTDSLSRQATVRDFLANRTGLESPTAMWTLTAIDHGEVLRRLRYARTLAPLRQAMVYSNLGYTVAGDATAAAAGMPFDVLLRDLVIKPLKLSSTGTYEQLPTMRNVAAAHATIAGRQQVIARDAQRQSIAPADAVQSSAADMARWMRLHLNNGVLDGTRYVSDSVLRAMHTVQIRIPTSPGFRAARLMQDTVSGYGLGWRIADYRGHRLLWHAGNGNGQLAFTALFPDDRLGITVLVNTWSAPDVHAALVNRIADTYLGYPARDWAGEAFARVPQQDSARAMNERAMIAMRTTVPPRLPLVAYAGRYDHAVFGPVWIRPGAGGGGLTLQMGEGQIADLEYHGADAFRVAWRDPFVRESYGTHAAFTPSGDSVAALTMLVRGDQLTARKAGVTGLAAASVPRPDLNGVDAIVGRWNLRTLNYLGPNDVYSNWLEIERSGFEGLVGRYVGLIGGARPIGSVEWVPQQRIARFSLPMEWEIFPAAWDVTTRDLRFEVRFVGNDSLTGVMVMPYGSMRAFAGKRAPSLLREMPKAWTPPVALFNGKDLSGWVVAPTARSLPDYWMVRDGVLLTTASEGANLMTVQKFQDFKLHAEFRLPKGGTSGIFPRGRYWVLLGERADSVPFHGTMGAVHRVLVPNENANLGPDVWQAIDITMVGRRITVVLNGKAVIADQIIPGITGSAIDSDEAAPGPIMLQGEEISTVEFRNITISVPVTSGAMAEP